MDTSPLFALAASASWAVGSLLFGHFGRRVSPGALNFAKCASAMLMLAGTWIALHAQAGDLAARALAPSGVSWALIAASAVAGLTVGDTAYFAAIREIGVGRAILLGSTAPLFATLGGVVLFDERVGAREIAGMALTGLGVVVVVTANRGGEAAGGRVAKGVALGLAAAVLQASGTMLARGAMRGGLDPLFAATARVFVASATLLAIAVVRRQLPTWRIELGEGRTLPAIAGAAFIGTYGGIWLSQLALAGSRSTGVTSALLATSPIFALPIERAVLGVPHGVRAFVGAVVAIAGIALLSS
jgi:drug/metabolite transporter (DMT)-like permease